MDASKAIVLLEGVITRTSIYPDAEENIHKLLDSHRGEIERGLRAIRVKEIGEEAAMQEKLAGSKADEEYAQEIASKREAREAEMKKKLDEEREALRRRAAKAEAIILEVKMKEAQAKEAQKLEQQKRLASRFNPGDYHERRNSRFDHPSRRDSTAKETSRRESQKDPLAEVKVDDDLALRALLTDTKEPGSRIRHQPTLEIDESLAPPPRKPKHISAINTNARDSPVPFKALDSKKETKSELSPDAMAPILNAPKGPKADIRINLGKSLTIGERTRAKSPDRSSSLHGESGKSTKYDERKGSDHRRESHRDIKEEKYDDDHRGSRRDSRPGPLA